MVTLIADLDCDVLRRFTQDICPNLFRMYTIQYTHGNAIMCDALLTVGTSHFRVLEHNNADTYFTDLSRW